jgi:hypothetical protein
MEKVVIVYKLPSGNFKRKTILSSLVKEFLKQLEINGCIVVSEFRVAGEAK